MTARVPEKRCEKTDLLQSMCSHCRGHDQTAVVVDAPDVGVRFEAAFEGHCANCGGRIHVGDVIARFGDVSGYACPECLP